MPLAKTGANNTVHIDIGYMKLDIFTGDNFSSILDLIYWSAVYPVGKDGV